MIYQAIKLAEEPNFLLITDKQPKFYIRNAGDL